MRILVVEDDPATSVALVELFGEVGQAVDAVSSAEAARSALLANRYALVVTDLVLPGKSGLVLARWMRARRPDVPLVVLTGHGSLETAVAALRQGVADYHLKPVEPRRLLATIERVLRRADAVAAEDGHPVLTVPVGTPIRQLEAQMIARTLDAHRWNKNRVARILGISRRALYNKLERYHIQRAAPD